MPTRSALAAVIVESLSEPWQTRCSLGGAYVIDGPGTKWPAQHRGPLSGNGLTSNPLARCPQAVRVLIACLPILPQVP